MREIKFRARVTANYKWLNLKVGDWAYGCFIHTRCDCPCLVFGDGDQVEINIKTLGQYTGMKDANGAAIYEGDVLTFDWRYQQSNELYAEDCEGIKGFVQWLNGKYVVRFFGGMSFDLSDINQSTFERFWKEVRLTGMHDYYKMTGFEVIGNIHQDPELLESK